MSKRESIAIPFFENITKRCRELIIDKYEKHGNSWAENQKLDRDFWKARILEEVEEWYNADNQKDSQIEMLDVINITSMIYTLENVHRKTLQTKVKQQ